MSTGGARTYKNLPAIVTAIDISEEQEGRRIPTVRFQTEDGRILEQKVTSARLADGIEVGDEVTVLYPQGYLRAEEDLRLSYQDSQSRFTRSFLRALRIVVAMMIVGIVFWVVVFYLLVFLFA